MHKLKQVRDELIDEAESYIGSIKGGDDSSVVCLKYILSAADHADALLERHGLIEDSEQESSGRRSMRSRSYGVDPYGRSYDDPANGVERGRTDRSGGGDHHIARELERLAEDVRSPELRRAIKNASRMAGEA